MTTWESEGVSWTFEPCPSVGHAGLWWWISCQSGTRWWAWSQCCLPPSCHPSGQTPSSPQPTRSSASSAWWWCQPERWSLVILLYWWGKNGCFFFFNEYYLSNWDGLLLHGLMDGHSVILSHLNKSGVEKTMKTWHGHEQEKPSGAGEPLTLSNSSMHTTPPSARTMAPPSMMNPRVVGSLSTEAVRPAALLPFPEV